MEDINAMQPIQGTSSAAVTSPQEQTNSSTSNSGASLGPHKVSIAGLDKAIVLMALFNNSKPQGNGAYAPRALKNMSIERAQQHTERNLRLSFDYVDGRIIKTNISGDVADTRLYDRDNGDNAGLIAIEMAKRIMNSVK
ncbi:hypothetical protein J7438_08410 [Thalassotalea sp. G20_0]|uniref:hypothetical protein n=1 Tax=Thalassotalea sp. G20_0 TaxID=2821093 RepID=UPI001ADBB8D2|nr:hypothetical protein [Thalassotalea sp. G20_0]MBO9494107.1 hypothetical protein [Thalassotalea sp. G20_0]